MENELKHFGIKGQKWGIRRYQNEDGTLTDAGKRRFGYDKLGKSSSVKELKQKREWADTSLAYKWSQKYADAQEKNIRSSQKLTSMRKDYTNAAGNKQLQDKITKDFFKELNKGHKEFKKIADSGFTKRELKNIKRLERESTLQALKYVGVFSIAAASFVYLTKDRD